MTTDDRIKYLEQRIQIDSASRTTARGGFKADLTRKIHQAQEEIRSLKTAAGVTCPDESK